MRSLSIVAVALCSLSTANAQQVKTPTSAPHNGQSPTSTHAPELKPATGTARGTVTPNPKLGTTNPALGTIKARRDGPSNNSFVSGGNNTCGSATGITGGGPFNGDNIGATTDGPNNCGAIANDVWYDWTANVASGSYDFSLCGSNYDTVIAVYDGNTCTGTLLGCDDDDPMGNCGLQSVLSNIPIVNGNVYKIQIGGYNGSTGNYTLNIAPTPPPPSCPCVGAPPEGEANCGLPTDTFDGGCNYTPVNYAALSLPGSVCGNGAFNGSYRDTDWYQFTVPAGPPQTVSWTITAEFNAYIFILDNNCPASSLGFAINTACNSMTATANLNPGTYVAWAGPDFSQIITCGTGDGYLGQLSSVAAPTCPCVGAPPEGEANCGLPTDTFDGGCNYTPLNYASLSLPGTVCGNGAFNGSYRDTDWYQFTVPAGPPQQVSWTITAEFNAYIFILDNNCPPSQLGFAINTSCNAMTAVANLNPGTYVAWAGPDFSQVFPCGTSDSYLGVLSSIAAPTCPCVGAPPEGEANCGLPTDTFDGGCNYTPVNYASLACGGSVCGNGAFNGSYRDTDWYQFTLPVASDVTWTVTSEFNSYIFILDNNCPPSLLAFAQQPACTPEVAFAAALPAGTYVAWCGPDFSQVFPCGTNDSYLGQLTCAPVLGSIGEFCAGDANAGCPCNNPGSGPGDGCHWNPAQDPTLRGGHLTSVGNPVASLASDVVGGANRVRLNCEGHRPLSGSIVAVSLLMQGHVGGYVTYGAGRRCIANPFKRVFYFQPTLSNETAPNDTTMPTESISHRSQVTGETLNPGDVRAYQLLYRDPTGYCSATFNASSGIEIVWGP
jgi:hypothetical protein